MMEFLSAHGWSLLLAFIVGGIIGWYGLGEKLVGRHG